MELLVDRILSDRYAKSYESTMQWYNSLNA